MQFGFILGGSKMAGQRVSLNPSTFTEGGLIDDVDVELTDVTFCIYDYNGQVPEGVLSLGVEITDGEGKKYNQYYSAGDKQYFVPSEDGGSLLTVGDKSALNGNTNAAQFLGSLINAGLDPAVIDSDAGVRALIGLQAHVKRVAQPKRSGLIKTGKNAERESTVLLVERIIAMPGQGKAVATRPKAGLGAPKAAAPVGLGGVKPNGGLAPRAAGAAPKAAAAPVAQAAAVDDDFVTEQLVGVLAANDGKLAKKDIPTKVFAALKDHPANVRGATSSRAFQDEYLSTGGGGAFTFDGATVALAG